ncbi:uncharacterized protein ACN63O_019266 [Diretmus argenteus]
MEEEVDVGKEGDQEDEEEKDAEIFNAWMNRYRGGEQQRRGEEEEGEAEGGKVDSTSSFEPPVRLRTDRRASLPCPSTLSAMQLLRLHSSTQSPVTAKVLLRRTSSRSLLPTPEEAGPAPECRRPSLIPTIPEATKTARKAHFRRRNVMSLSDADSVCLICHDDLSKGGSGIRELQCTHTFHRECIEEWLWSKQSCPTCSVQVSMPHPLSKHPGGDSDSNAFP